MLSDAKRLIDLDYVDKHFVPIERYNQLEKEIEELKEEKGYHLGFIDGGIAKRYEMENKIKAKIEVLEKLQEEFPNNDEIRIKIIAYKELLEKE